MGESKKQIASTIALVLGIIGAIAPFTYFLMVLGFLAVPGLILAIIGFKKNKNTLSKISLGINIVAALILLSFIIAINYSDYKSSKTVYQYYLPKGFSGWVIIKTKSSDAKRLSIQGNFPGGTYKIIIPASGKIETNESLEDWHRTNFFWYDKKDTIAFSPEIGAWGDADYKTLIHCEGASNGNYQHFYVSDKPRNPQDTVILTACEGLFDELKKK